MILAFDTYYFKNRARTVCFSFEAFTDDEPASVYTDTISGIEEYDAGSFYKRELPCIIHLLERYRLRDIDLIIVDGFVVLDDDGAPGLGGHLFEHLGGTAPVIGVAKSDFSRVSGNKRAVFRGTSVNPLYITALGIDLDEAAGMIRSMKGDHRIPKLLKELDAMTKSGPMGPED